MDIGKTARDLTIAQYVLLRTIAQRGDWNVTELHDIPTFDDDDYTRLREKGLLAVRNDHCHPTNCGHAVLPVARAFLGISEL